MPHPKNSYSPAAPLPLRINLAKDKIGWRKHKPMFLSISSKVLLGILLIICSPLLPIVGLLYLLHLYDEHRKRRRSRTEF